VNGDQVRNVRLPQRGGYRAADVDDLLNRVAAELDAGRPAGPLIASAAFRERFFPRGGYDSGAVDWFLDQLRRGEDPSEAAGSNADPWRDLAAEPYCVRREPGDPAERITAPSAQEYADEWHGFGQQPGTRLSWVRAGAMRRELRTADQQTVASSRHATAPVVGHFIGDTLSVAGRSFTLQPVTGSAWPGIAETVSRDWPGGARMVRRQPGDRDPSLRQLLNETGPAVLYWSGGGRYIKFPGQRWLRFPVRGTRGRNAIMTAVDQAGNKVARYRLAPAKHQWWTDVTDTVEIIVHPSQRLTEELCLVLALSAPWLISYFASKGGGG
jgi:DivIVA domain-containing protein